MLSSQRLLIGPTPKPRSKPFLYVYASACVTLWIAGISVRAAADEWNCAAIFPEASGTFQCTTDCTMTSAGVSLTGDMSITGDSAITTITAKTGGGRHFNLTSGNNHTLTLRWLNLTGGNGEYSGGSIYVGSGSTLHATYCAFIANHASGGGGCLFGNSGSSIQLFHSNVTDNTALKRGGALWSMEGSVRLIDTIVARNTAVNRGGGIRQNRGSLALFRCLVLENTKTGNGAGSSEGGGGLSIVGDTVVTIRESSFVRNHASGLGNGHQIMVQKYAQKGGAASITTVSTKFVHCSACASTGTSFYLYDADTPLVSRDENK